MNIIYSFKNVYAEYLKFIDYRLKNQTKRTLQERFNKRILPYFENYNINEIKERDYLNWQLEIYNMNFSIKKLSKNFENRS